MEQRYTVNELKSLVNLSHQAIYNRVEKGRFNSIVERVDSRNVTFILFNDKEWEELIKDVGLRNKVESTFNQDDSIETTYSNVTQNQTSQINQAEMMGMMFENFNKFTQQLNQVHKDYKDEIVNSRSQLKLLEDSESRTKREFSELNAENIQLKHLNQELLSKVNQLELVNQNSKKELENNKGWKFWK